MARRALEDADTGRLVEAANKLTESPRNRARLAEGKRLYLKAFRRGHAIAGYNLACTYQNQGDYRAAVRWYRRALDAGEQSALFPLAQAELWGVGTARNVKAALAKLESIASARVGFAQFEREQSMVIIARTLLEGWPAPRDYRTALKWLRRASGLGSAEAAGLLEDLGEKRAR